MSTPRSTSREPLPLVVESDRQLRVLESAARQEIVDVLASAGASSVTAIGRALGRPADSLYYHLRMLQRAGLVSEVSAELERSEAIYRIHRNGLRLTYELGPARRARVGRIIAAALREAERDFGSALRAGRARSAEGTRNAWAGRCRGWLSRRDLAEAGSLLARLSALLRRPDRGDRSQLVSFTYALAPLDDRGGRAV